MSTSDIICSIIDLETGYRKDLVVDNSETLAISVGKVFMIITIKFSMGQLSEKMILEFQSKVLRLYFKVQE